jgi:hypothetical protein
VGPLAKHETDNSVNMYNKTYQVTREDLFFQVVGQGEEMPCAVSDSELCVEACTAVGH